MTSNEINDKAAVAERGASVAPEKTSSKKGASRKNGAPKLQKTAKGAKAKTGARKKDAKAAGPRKDAMEARGNKKADIIAMLSRNEGATLSAIMKATDWQAHSVRGFISGALIKKSGLKVESFIRRDGERAYAIR